MSYKLRCGVNCKYAPSIVEAMLEFLRSGLFLREPNIEVKDIDWEALMKVSSEQGVLPWVWDGICQLPIEKSPSRFQKISWVLSVQSCVDRYEKQRKVLSELVEICTRNDMRLMLLKGIGLSQMYTKPYYRSSGDIDIFLFDNFEKGNTVFGLDTETDTGLHTEFVYNGVQVENHEMFVYPNTPPKKRVSQYLNSRIPSVILTEDGYYTFDTLDNLVYLMMHALNHVNFNEGSSFLNVRNLLDIAMLIYRNQNLWDVNVVKDLMERLQLTKSFDLIVYLSELLLEIDLSAYRCGSIKKGDERTIRELFCKTCLCVTVPSEELFVRRVGQCIYRYFLLYKIYRYMPRHKKSFFLMSMHGLWMQNNHH